MTALPPLKLSSPATGEFWELEVVHEDARLLAINKPARLLVSPDRYDPRRPNLMRLLEAGVTEGKPWAVARGLTYLSNAHRLDFETTGVLLLCVGILASMPAAYCMIYAAFADLTKLNAEPEEGGGIEQHLVG